MLARQINPDYQKEIRFLLQKNKRDEYSGNQVISTYTSLSSGKNKKYKT